MKTLLLLITIITFTFALDVGDKAPAFSMKTVSGDSFDLLSNSEDSGPTMLIFWATWCPACKEEIPHVKEIKEKFSKKGLRVLAVNVGVNDSQARVQKFKAKYKMNYPVSFDKGSKITKEYGVMGTPTVMMIDKNGVVKYKSPALPDNLEKHFDSLL